MRTAWILRDGDVLAAAEVTDRFVDRSRGLLGRDRYEGALVLLGSRAVHSVGVRFPLDVAFLDDALVVREVVRLGCYRVALPRLRCRIVLQAEAGSFERWGLQTGDHLEVRETP
jgi:uncharacterized membrane protein (UPF0127 family)